MIALFVLYTSFLDKIFCNIVLSYLYQLISNALSPVLSNTIPDIPADDALFAIFTRVDSCNSLIMILDANLLTFSSGKSFNSKNSAMFGCLNKDGNSINSDFKKVYRER